MSYGTLHIYMYMFGLATGINAALTLNLTRQALDSFVLSDNPLYVQNRRQFDVWLFYKHVLIHNRSFYLWLTWLTVPLRNYQDCRGFVWSDKCINQSPESTYFMTFTWWEKWLQFLYKFEKTKALSAQSDNLATFSNINVFSKLFEQTKQNYEMIHSRKPHPTYFISNIKKENCDYTSVSHVFSRYKRVTTVKNLIFYESYKLLRADWLHVNPCHVKTLVYSFIFSQNDWFKLLRSTISTFYRLFQKANLVT